MTKLTKALTKKNSISIFILHNICQMFERKEFLLGKENFLNDLIRATVITIFVEKLLSYGVCFILGP